LDNIRKHGGAFTDEEYEATDEDGNPASDARIQFQTTMKILCVRVISL
jgi:hypothetical protein